MFISELDQSAVRYHAGCFKAFKWIESEKSLRSCSYTIPHFPKIAVFADNTSYS